MVRILGGDVKGNGEGGEDVKNRIGPNLRQIRVLKKQNIGLDLWKCKWRL